MRLVLGHAWLNLWDKHLATGKINQIPIRELRGESRLGENTTLFGWVSSPTHIGKTSTLGPTDNRRPSHSGKINFEPSSRAFIARRAKSHKTQYVSPAIRPSKRRQAPDLRARCQHNLAVFQPAIGERKTAGRRGRRARSSFPRTQKSDTSDFSSFFSSHHVKRSRVRHGSATNVMKRESALLPFLLSMVLLKPGDDFFNLLCPLST